MSHLEQWGRDRELEAASEALQPIIQASQLLQARKTDEDVNSVCEMCNKLTANQIVKILNLYTPADDYESRVPVSFIKKVQEKLKERGENNEQVSALRRDRSKMKRPRMIRVVFDSYFTNVSETVSFFFSC